MVTFVGASSNKDVSINHKAINERITMMTSRMLTDCMQICTASVCACESWGSGLYLQPFAIFKYLSTSPQNVCKIHQTNAVAAH